MILYKYVDCEDAVRSIASGSLKFTEINRLNDPSELMPLMNRDVVRSSLTAIRKIGYSQEQYRWLGYQETILRLLSPETMVLSRPETIELANATLALPIFDDVEYMERQLLKTINLIRSRVGILSLTERFDSLPMWAHYGKNANGYVVRFEGLRTVFPGDRTGSLNCLKPIRYVENLVGMTHDPSTQDNLFFCKFQDWSYEHEWRVVSALSSCDLDVGKSLYRQLISPVHVTGVICGWNVSVGDNRRLAHEVQNVNPGVRVLIAALDSGRVVLRDFQ